MWFRSDPFLTLRIAVLMTVFSLASPSLWAQDSHDVVAEYLESHGLDRLLALHLHEQLAQARGEQRERVLERLAVLYASLLEVATDPAERDDLEARGRRLLDEIENDRAFELRYALIRSPYGVAERLAENHRLRLTSANERLRAEQMFLATVNTLKGFAAELRGTIEANERRVGRATGAAAAGLQQQIQDQRSLLRRAHFTLAWSLYYHGWLAGDRESLDAAIDGFARVLDPVEPVNLPEHVSRDLLRNDAFARAVLGMALARAAGANYGAVDSADRWLELLELSHVPASLRQQRVAWRIAIRLDAGQFARVRDIIGEEEIPREELPLAWLRLMAVYGLESSTADPEAQALAEFALAEMASRGELQQVLDLAERYGVEALGRSGFAAWYVRGAETYQRARLDHDHDAPTSDSALIALYQEAAQAFQRAVEQEDVTQFSEASRGARLMIAWCLFFQGKFAEAADQFEAMAMQLSDREAEEVLWMAVVSRDHLAREESSDAASAGLGAAIDRYLSRFPESGRAPQLILRRAESQSRPTLASVERLLAIPEGDSAYISAQSRAAQMLYMLFIQEVDEKKLEVGEQYIHVALPLMNRGVEGIDADAENAAQVFVVRGRRILDVAMTRGISRFSAAREALVRLEEAERFGLIDLSPYEEELLYRRVQEREASGQLAESELLADRMWADDPESPWSRNAARLLFREAVHRWRQGDDVTPDLLERLIRHGQRVLQEFGQDTSRHHDPAVLSVFASVAEAAFTHWQLSRDSAMAELAEGHYRRLIELRPREASFLRALGLLAAHSGDVETSLDCWRRLLAGHAVESNAWYEAKYELMRVLIGHDPGRARAVMDQHKALYPEYGSSAWRERYETLDEQIDAAIDSFEGGVAR